MENSLIKNLKVNWNLIFRISGFILIFCGATMLIRMTCITCPNVINEGKNIAIYFFIIMLGVSFAFPSLLQSADENLSTMRIVVFMLINVICMLMLKDGWDTTSLDQIKLDANWMGIIAFAFGAKATQSYFENKK